MTPLGPRAVAGLASFAALAALAAPAAPGTPTAGGALPAEASRRYRVEIAGEPVGWASLSVKCAALGCRAAWESALRAPAEAGGGELRRRIAIATDRAGALERAEVQVRDGRGERRREAGPGPVPASLAELLLSHAPEGEERCLDVGDEESGERGRACARRTGAWLEGEVLGEPLRFRARPGLPPDEVVLPRQGARFVADPAARIPEAAPRLFGVEVPRGPGARLEGPLRFCGAPAEPPAEPLPGLVEVPSDLPADASCREKTSRYLARASALGIGGRHAVGVAWNGTGFVWHEWAELLVGGRWSAVDPAFRQAPAQGPRFAVARFEGDDALARSEAGRRVLECWGRARVEAGR